MRDFLNDDDFDFDEDFDIEMIRTHFQPTEDIECTNAGCLDPRD